MAAPSDAAERERIITDVLTRVATGELTGRVLESHGIGRTTWSEWCRADRVLASDYARAREEQAHAHAEQAIEITDGEDALSAFYALCIDRWETESLEAAVTKGDRDKVWTVANSMRSQAVQRDKMRSDARKWHASKLNPKGYGDRVDVTSDGKALVAAVIALPLEEMPPVLAPVAPVGAENHGEVPASGQ